MRRLLAALGFIRPSGPIEIVLPKAEDEGFFTVGGPYFIGTAKGLEGPFWPALLGPRPEGYLPDPADPIVTFGHGVSERMLSLHGVAGDAKDRGKKA